MKKILVLATAILVTNAANARTECYVSAKLGAGDTTTYVDHNDTLGDALVKMSEEETGNDGYRYSDSGLLWEASVAAGLDWSPGKMYVKKNPYDWFHLRLEAEFGYNNYRETGKLRYDYTITDKIKIEYDRFFMLVNGYADFRIDDVVPYVGLGMGYGLGKEEIRITNEHGRFSDYLDDDGLIYALHAGVGYRYSDITTLDLGFRRVYAPAEDGGRYIFDTLRLGARFRI
ncbi:MAG: porin family protein [Alphaproteobacteria bacterium]|nr:porin family protein [Alphaproteobacteria bacterium]